MIEFSLPIRTISEANSHEHWRKRQARAKSQRGTSAMIARSTFSPPLVITLTRVAPRKLDSDNAVGALKHVRDGLADFLRIDDGDDRLDWLYAPQIKGAKGEYAVLVKIEKRA